MKTECTQSALINPRTLIGFALRAAGVVLAFGPLSSAVAVDNGAAELSASVPAQATEGIWTATDDLGTPRTYHTATLLPNGEVLVAGGTSNDLITSLASAELYDPIARTWTATGSMTTARGIHTATLLPSGQVLVAGGFDGFDHLASSELYDPATGMWTTTGSMTTARSIHTATLLPSGQVLVAGGEAGLLSLSLTSAELYESAPEAVDIQ